MLATFFGVLRYDELFVNQYELAGNIGDFFGAALARLFGVLGGIIILITGMFIALFIALPSGLVVPASNAAVAEFTNETNRGRV